MKINEYLIQKGLLWTNSQFFRIKIIGLVGSFCYFIVMTIFGIPVLLHLFGDITLDAMIAWIMILVVIILFFSVMTVMFLFFRKTYNKKMMYQLYNKSPEKFNIEMSETTAEEFEAELRSINLGKAWRDKHKDLFIKQIQLHEWEWKPAQDEQQ